MGCIWNSLTALHANLSLLFIMSARYTGIFPREGFNLDNSFKLAEGAGAPAPVTITNCRTLRVIATGVNLTGDAVVAIEIGGEIVYSADAAQFASDLDPNGVLILHVRGHSKPGNNCGYVLFANTGTASVAVNGGIFVELVDGPAR